MKTQEVISVQHPAGEIRLPYIVIKGSSPGPSLGVLGGVHGSEYIGIEAARRLAQMEPGEFAGMLKIIPVVNVPAFLERSIAICPVDGAAIGRLFPGDADGGYSDALIARVWDLMSDVEHVVDLHGGDLHETLTAYSQWSITGKLETDGVSRGMAEAFDMPFIVAKEMPSGDNATGSFADVSACRGRPGILAEAGSHGVTDEALIAQTHHRGLLNVMRYLGMLEGAVERKHTPVQLKSFAAVKSPFDGYFYSVVAAGQTVWKGQILGEVVDMFTGERAPLEAPADAVILGLVTSLAVKRDTLVLGLGTL